MPTSWIVTPFFLDARDAALAAAVPANLPCRLNDPGTLADRSPASLVRSHAPIAAFTAETILRGEIPVSVAGDCVASLPVMAGAQKAGLAPILVWLDAHGDFNTPETSPSGFLGGMPLAMMVGRGSLVLPRASGLSPLEEDDVWLLGARDLDPPEVAALNGSRVHRADLVALHTLSFDRPVHLHIDNDVIDAAEVPANNYPVPGGPSLDDTICATAGFAARNAICAVSLSGWNSALDTNGATARACASLLAALADTLA